MNLTNFFKEDNGNESSMRALVAFIVICVMGTWAYTSITSTPRALAPLDWQTVGAVIGALMAKAWQKKSEEKGVITSTGT